MREMKTAEMLCDGNGAHDRGSAVLAPGGGRIETLGMRTDGELRTRPRDVREQAKLDLPFRRPPTGRCLSPTRPARGAWPGAGGVRGGHFPVTRTAIALRSLLAAAAQPVAPQPVSHTHVCLGEVLRPPNLMPVFARGWPRGWCSGRKWGAACRAERPACLGYPEGPQCARKCQMNNFKVTAMPSHSRAQPSHPLVERRVGPGKVLVGRLANGLDDIITPIATCFHEFLLTKTHVCGPFRLEGHARGSALPADHRGNGRCGG